MKFIDLLWGARREPSPSLQERTAAYTLHGQRDVKATPQRPPVPKEKP